MFRLHKVLLFLMLALVIVATLPPQLKAQTQYQAAVIVRAGEGNVQTSCIEFSEEQISGFDALLRSGLEIETDSQGIGALVCNIDGTGCPANDCLCQCQGGGNCTYWSYWHRLEGNWQFSQAGASLYPVTDGAVEGWSWGPGAVNEAIPPPDYTFEMVCQAEPTNTPTPTDTVVPTETHVPTNTPALTDKPAPTATPLPKATHTPAPPTQTPLPSHTPVPQAPGINFWADVGTISAGSCTTLRWQVTNSATVLLNGRGVSQQGVREVCPAQSETYTLNVVHPDGEEQRTLLVNVLATTAFPVPTITPQAVTVALALATVTVSQATITPPPADTPLPKVAIAAESSNASSAQIPTATTASITISPSPSARVTSPATLAAALAPATIVTPLPGDSVADSRSETMFALMLFALILAFVVILGFVLVKRMLCS